MKKSVRASALRMPWRPWLLLAWVLSSLALVCINLALIFPLRLLGISTLSCVECVKLCFARKATSALTGRPGNESAGITAGIERGRWN